MVVFSEYHQLSTGAKSTESYDMHDNNMYNIISDNKIIKITLMIFTCEYHSYVKFIRVILIILLSEMHGVFCWRLFSWLGGVCSHDKFKKI